VEAVDLLTDRPVAMRSDGPRVSFEASLAADGVQVLRIIRK